MLYLTLMLPTRRHQVPDAQFPRPSPLISSPGQDGLRVFVEQRLGSSGMSKRLRSNGACQTSRNTDVLLELAVIDVATLRWTARKGGLRPTYLPQALRFAGVPPSQLFAPAFTKSGEKLWGKCSCDARGKCARVGAKSSSHTVKTYPIYKIIIFSATVKHIDDVGVSGDNEAADAGYIPLPFQQ